MDWRLTLDKKKADAEAPAFFLLGLSVWFAHTDVCRDSKSAQVSLVKTDFVIQASLNNNLAKNVSCSCLPQVAIGVNTKHHC